MKPSKKEQDMQDHTWQDKQDDIPFFALTQQILGCCFKVMNALGSGFLESVYKNALVISMSDTGMHVITDRCFEVLFEGRKEKSRIQKSASSCLSCHV